MKKKKIFIIIAGQLRFFNENYETLSTTLKNYDLFFYFFPWNSEKNKISLFKKRYIPCKIKFIKGSNWEKKAKKIKFKDNANDIINFFYMWEALIKAFKIISSEINDNDIILRFRTDIKLSSKKIVLNFNDIKKNEIYIPDLYHWNGVNDQIFFSKVITLNKFKFFFDFVDFSIKNNHFICPEFTFYKFLKKFKIKINFFELDYKIFRNDRKTQIINKPTVIPFFDKILIKVIKLKFKLRNFFKFYFFKKKRNKNQNYFYEKI